VARDRILAVLRARVVCYSRELERRVCEVGYDFRTTPINRIADPVHYTAAMTSLRRAKRVRPVDLQIDGHSYRFFHLESAAADAVRTALERKAQAVAAYMRIERQPPLSGHHAERIHHHALVASPAWFSAGWEPGKPITRLHDRVIDPAKPGDVDFAGIHLPSHIPVVVQVKNRREWVYAADEVVWQLFGAAAQLNAFPILVARRVPATTYRLMKLAGGFAFRTVKMILPAALQQDEQFIAALQELGFLSDVDFIDAPLQRHRNFWSDLLPTHIEERWPRFQAVMDEVEGIAYAERLCSESVRHGRVSGLKRDAIVKGFQDRAYERIGQEALERWREDHPGWDEPDEPDPF
jgi:hypothetical protein